MYMNLFTAGVIPVAMLFSVCCTRSSPNQPVRVHTPVMQQGIVEIQIEYPDHAPHPFFEHRLEAEFRSPNGGVRRVAGFYYGDGKWAVRMRPLTVGLWTYRYWFQTNRGRHTGGGSFDWHARSVAAALRIESHDRYRWVTAEGKAFFPLGIQDCVGRSGRHPTAFWIDGEGRDDGKGRSLSPAAYFDLYAKAGFNLFRFSQRNCSYAIFEDLDRYSQDAGIATDELLAAARAHGFRVMFGIFGFHGEWAGDGLLPRIVHAAQSRLGWLEEAITDPSRRNILEKELRFIDYCIARWGVYTDIWELLNERRASDEWTSIMAAHIHAADPDSKPVATSWEKPYLRDIDIDSPHWYESEPLAMSDIRIVQLAAEWKKSGKPVIVGEHGNTGMNWDPGSAVRMRIRAWTSLFEDVGLVFWNTSWSKYGMYQGGYTPGQPANIYIGPQERRFMSVLDRFRSRLKSGMRRTELRLSGAYARAYALESADLVAAYLRNASTSAVRSGELKLSWDDMSHSPLSIEWIDPATGNVMQHALSRTPTGLDVPPFDIDLALLASRTAWERQP
jgi:hypothetical protein